MSSSAKWNRHSTQTAITLADGPQTHEPVTSPQPQKPGTPAQKPDQPPRTAKPDDVETPIKVGGNNPDPGSSAEGSEFAMSRAA